MTSFNLMGTCFQPDIQCKTPAVDGYEVSNLLKQARLFGKNGFLAESFIKPPVDIKLIFPCRINLHKILLDTKVGAQYSTGFEIFSYSEKTNGKPKGTEFDGRIFPVIGKGTADKHLFCFVNNRFARFFAPKRGICHLRAPSHIENTNHDGNSLAVFELTNRRDDLLCDVSDVTIRIRSVARGSVCAVKSVEIWGYPSKWVPGTVIRDLIASHNLTIQANETQAVTWAPDVCVASRDPTNVSRLFESSASATPIPPDFLDALTHDVMAMPMLLPSGHSVDQSSLDRHSEEQARWGRAPSDPFTFKPFSNTHKPVLNVALKVRIDEFLLRNPELEVSRRTLGRSDNQGPAKITTSHLVQENCKSETKSSHTELKRGYIAPSSLRLATANENPPRIASPLDKHLAHELSRNSESNKRQKMDMSNFHQCTVSRGSLCDVSPVETGVGNGCSALTKHGEGLGDRAERSERLTRSLNSALSSVLGRLPSYSRVVSATNSGSAEPNRARKEPNPSQSDQGCVVCGGDSIAALYRLTCDHVVCRDCLLKQSRDIMCSVCSVVTSKSDVVKVHK